VRSPSVKIIGFVNPVVKGLTIRKPWTQGLWVQSNANGQYTNITVEGGPNLTTSNAYTYGVYPYGMEFGAEFRDITVKQARHGITTGDNSNGNAYNAANWHNYGYNKNNVVTSIV
jgi:hypothetical protein